MDHRLDARPEVRMDQDTINGSKGSHRGQTGKARAMTMSQVPQGPKASQGTSLLRMEVEVCLNRKIFREEQLKDPASVDAFCGSRRVQG